MMIAYGGVPVANGSGDLQSCNFVIWEFLRRHYAGHTAIPAWHNNSEAPRKVMQTRCHEQRSPSKADASTQLEQPYLAWLYLSLMAEEWFPALALQKSTCSKTRRTVPSAKLPSMAATPEMHTRFAGTCQVACWLGLLALWLQAGCEAVHEFSAVAHLHMPGAQLQVRSLVRRVMLHGG